MPTAAKGVRERRQARRGGPCPAWPGPGRYCRSEAPAPLHRKTAIRRTSAGLASRWLGQARKHRGQACNRGCLRTVHAKSGTHRPAIATTQASQPGHKQREGTRLDDRR